MTAMSVLAVRFLLITGPVGAAIVAINLSPAISDSAIGRRWSPVLVRLTQPARGGLALANTVLVALLLVGGIGLAVARAAPISQHEEIAKEFPADAVAWLQTHDAGARIFNKYEWGGYLGLMLPTQPIFIDGRADVYGDAVIREYVSLIGLEEIRRGPSTSTGSIMFCTRRGTVLSSWLDSNDEWARVYEDADSVVWKRSPP